MGRGWGPPFAGGESSFFLGLNRGKRGISIDLKKPEGLDLCLRLIDKMDVLIEDFRRGAMDRIGLGWESVRKRSPRFAAAKIWRHAGRVGVIYSNHYEEKGIMQRLMTRLRSISVGPDGFVPVIAVALRC